MTELIQKVDQEIGKIYGEKEKGIPGAEGRLAQAENRHAELMARRDRRRTELAWQRSLTLQGVEPVSYTHLDVYKRQHCRGRSYRFAYRAVFDGADPEG